MPIWGQILIVFGGVVLAAVLVPYILKGFFKIVSTLRLWPLLLYSLIAAGSLIFTNWVKVNFKWVMIGFFVVLGLIILGWIITIFTHRADKNMVVNQLCIADQLGIPKSQIVIKDNVFYDTVTRKPIFDATNDDEDEEGES